MSLQTAKEYKHMLLDSVQGAIRRVDFGQNTYSCLALTFALLKEIGYEGNPLIIHKDLCDWMLPEYKVFVTEAHLAKEWKEHKEIENDFDTFFASRFDDPKEARLGALAAFKQHLEKLL